MKLKQALIFKDIDDAIQKGKVDLKTTIPAFLTPEKLLEINQKLYETTTKVMSNVLQELVQEVQIISLSNPIVEAKMKEMDVDWPK